VYPKVQDPTERGSTSPLVILSWEVQLEQPFLGKLCRSFGLYGSYVGVEGLHTILSHIFGSLASENKFNCKIKYSVSSSSRLSSFEGFASSILQVYPSKKALASSTGEVSEAKIHSWNAEMSRIGRMLKTAQGLNNKEIEIFEKLRSEFLLECRNPVINIPSDTGLVQLTGKMNLIALKEIEKGTVITSVPITKSDMLSNPIVLVNGFSVGRMIKKVSPFCGMGSFASFAVREKSNCETTKYHNYFVALIAHKNIRPGEEIVCDCNCIQLDRKEIHKLDSMSEFMKILEDIGEETKRGKR